MVFDGQLFTGIAALITSISSLVWALRRQSAERLWLRKVGGRRAHRPPLEANFHLREGTDHEPLAVDGKEVGK